MERLIDKKKLVAFSDRYAFLHLFTHEMKYSLSSLTVISYVNSISSFMLLVYDIYMLAYLKNFQIYLLQNFFEMLKYIHKYVCATLCFKC